MTEDDPKPEERDRPVPPWLLAAHTEIAQVRGTQGLDRRNPSPPSESPVDAAYRRIQRNLETRLELIDHEFGELREAAKNEVSLTEKARNEAREAINALQKDLAGQIREWDQKLRQAEKNGWQSLEKLAAGEKEIHALNEARDRLAEQFRSFQRRLGAIAEDLDAHKHAAGRAEASLAAKIKDLADDWVELKGARETARDGGRELLKEVERQSEFQKDHEVSVQRRLERVHERCRELETSSAAAKAAEEAVRKDMEGLKDEVSTARKEADQAGRRQIHGDRQLASRITDLDAALREEAQARTDVAGQVSAFRDAFQKRLADWDARIRIADQASADSIRSVAAFDKELHDMIETATETGREAKALFHAMSIEDESLSERLDKLEQKTAELLAAKQDPRPAPEPVRGTESGHFSCRPSLREALPAAALAAAMILLTLGAALVALKLVP